MAKLFQDLELEWSFRNQPNNTNRSLRLLIAKKTLLSELTKQKDADKLISTVYYVLLLNVLRIYPYANDKDTVIFLNNAIDKVINIIKSIKKEVNV